MAAPVKKRTCRGRGEGVHQSSPILSLIPAIVRPQRQLQQLLKCTTLHPHHLCVAHLLHPSVQCLHASTRNKHPRLAWYSEARPPGCFPPPISHQHRLKLEPTSKRSPERPLLLQVPDTTYHQGSVNVTTASALTRTTESQKHTRDNYFHAVFHAAQSMGFIHLRASSSFCQV